MQAQIITSESNEKIKLFKSLLNAKGIKEQQKFIVSGSKLIQEFFAQKLNRFKVYAVLFDSENFPDFILKQQDLPKFVIPKAAFKELDIVGTNEALLVLEYKEFDNKDFQQEPLDLELICPLGDPRNLGALARSAVGFGVHEIILTKEAAHPYLPQSVKASAGAVLFAHFRKTDLALSEIPIVGANLALDLSGENIDGLKWPKNLRLWVGEEGPGLKLSVLQTEKIQFITIPTSRIESLNAMASTTLALWEYRKAKKL